MNEEVKENLEIEDCLLLAVLTGVEVVQTGEDGRLQQRAVARLHAAVEKHLDAITEHDLLWNVNHEL